MSLSVKYTHECLAECFASRFRRINRCSLVIKRISVTDRVPVALRGKVNIRGELYGQARVGHAGVYAVTECRKPCGVGDLKSVCALLFIGRLGNGCTFNGSTFSLHNDRTAALRNFGTRNGI